MRAESLASDIVGGVRDAGVRSLIGLHDELHQETQTNSHDARSTAAWTPKALSIVSFSNMDPVAPIPSTAKSRAVFESNIPSWGISARGGRKHNEGDSENKGYARMPQHYPPHFGIASTSQSSSEEAICSPRMKQQFMSIPIQELGLVAAFIAPLHCTTTVTVVEAWNDPLVPMTVSVY